MSTEPANPHLDILNAFRIHYYRYYQAVHNAAGSGADSTVLERLGDDLDVFANLINEHADIFEAEELNLFQNNVRAMQDDVRQQYEHTLNHSHYGHPVVVQTIRTGRQGRPSIQIDPSFLRWAYSVRTTSAISRFLNVSRQTVRNALIEHGIVQPQADPFLFSSEAVEGTSSESTLPNSDAMVRPETLEADDILDPHLPIPSQLPHDHNSPALVAGPTTLGPITLGSRPILSFTGSLSTLTDQELDGIILNLRHHYRRAGVTMLHGMLLQLGHRVPREHIRLSLLRIDPVQRIFERIRIRRRVYSVPGPNSLWHHDGQHGLIRWGIVIHGFIDGYSRLITALQASNNNLGQTVLELFLNACLLFGVPSRLRGDHGVENLLVAAWMEQYWGQRRGSYIWGRSVHNVRIERLWVDVTAQLGSAWADRFVQLELHHGLNINSPAHIWLLHYLFLPTINQELVFFAQSWNNHTIQIRNGPNRSPVDMFGFDMLVHGVRGGDLREEDLSEEELEVFGVDWEALQDETVLDSVRGNTPQREESTSWIGRAGPPDHLNEVPLDPPDLSLPLDSIQIFNQLLKDILSHCEEVDSVTIWIHGLALARRMYSDIF